MNTSKLIWGILCLVVAGVLTILNLTLPPENLMFMIGDINAPWVPVVGFAIAGLVLLLGVNEKAEATPLSEAQDSEKVRLNKRLENIAWGLFLIMLGGFALVPDETIPKGLWAIGVGLIMVGLNAARYFNQLKMSGFTTFLGLISLLGGVAELIGYTSLEGALLLIILGAYLILKPWFEKQRLFGKAEES